MSLRAKFLSAGLAFSSLLSAHAARAHDLKVYTCNSESDPSLLIEFAGTATQFVAPPTISLVTVDSAGKRNVTNINISGTAINEKNAYKALLFPLPTNADIGGLMVFNIKYRTVDDPSEYTQFFRPLKCDQAVLQLANRPAQADTGGGLPTSYRTVIEPKHGGANYMMGISHAELTATKGRDGSYILSIYPTGHDQIAIPDVKDWRATATIGKQTIPFAYDRDRLKSPPVAIDEKQELTFTLTGPCGPEEIFIAHPAMGKKDPNAIPDGVNCGVPLPPPSCKKGAFTTSYKFG